MNQKCAICISLLKGEVVSIMNGFTWFGCTNIPREIGRSIERSFNVKIDRKTIHKKTKYNEPCWYFEYRLLRNSDNKDGIERMKLYVEKISKSQFIDPHKMGKKVVNIIQKVEVNDLFC